VLMKQEGTMPTRNASLTKRALREGRIPEDWATKCQPAVKRDPLLECAPGVGHEGLLISPARAFGV